jgi:hypothetical protein
MTARITYLLVGSALLAGLAGACGSSVQGGSSFDDGGSSDGTTGPSRDGAHDGGGKPGKDSGPILGNPDVHQAFDVEPSALQTLTVKVGASSPTETYKATANGGPANASWSVDRADIGSITTGASSTGVFTPSGTTGGLVTITASGPGQPLTRKILVKLTATQSGASSSAAETAQVPTTVAQLSAGGGVGGVGGEGLGGAVTDPAALAALVHPGAGDAGLQGLTLLYPYDKTVWPRGMLAPLLMWSWAPGDADAIQIELATTSGSFSWTGTFGRPTILAMSGGNYIRSPIPQDIWDMATNTAGALTTAGTPDALTVKLTVEKAGVGAGPITETWPVAPGRLTGTVYYNSYGTQLVKNWANPDGAGHAVGAAILGITSGATAPSLVVGENSPLGTNGIPTDDSGCRVCHVVSSRGRWLISQSEQGSPGDGQSYLYDLTAADVQGSAVALTQQGTFGWAAMVSDGSYALTNEINPSSTNAAIGTSTSSFWQFGAAPTTAPLNGLDAGLAAGYPSYAPDDKLVAYLDVTGQASNFHSPLLTAAYDSATQTFSNVQTVAMPATGQRIGYPVFLPDDSGLLFETEVRQSTGDTVMVTRNGARSELWWVKLGSGTPTPVRLDVLNGNSGGASYLPTNANNHGTSGASDPETGSYSEVGFDDTTLNYEPTMLPLVAGGYAWVVFTSRRLYGNQLTAVPWLSWPPDYDTTNLAQATVKKLWVAAINLSDPASSDISHPAFYLPAQEILAGNSRGFWVLDPCKADGQSCVTGDQCCNGYCEANGDGGALVCSNTTTQSCSGVQEKCTTAANCCDPSDICADGFCAVPPSK